MTKVPVCEISEQLEWLTGVYKAKMYSCYTAKEDQYWRSTRACLCAFNTGGTTRRHVLKLFACLKMDHLNNRGIVGDVSENPCATQAIKALIAVLHWWPPLSKFNRNSLA